MNISTHKSTTLDTPRIADTFAAYPHYIKHCSMFLNQQLVNIARAASLAARLHVIGELNNDTTIKIAPDKKRNASSTFALECITFDDHTLTHWIEQQNHRYEVFKDKYLFSNPWDNDFKSLLRHANRFWLDKGLRLDTMRFFERLMALPLTEANLSNNVLSLYKEFKSASTKSLNRAIDWIDEHHHELNDSYMSTLQQREILFLYTRLIFDNDEGENTIQIYTSSPVQHLLDPQ